MIYNSKTSKLKSQFQKRILVDGNLEHLSIILCFLILVKVHTSRRHTGIKDHFVTDINEKYCQYGKNGHDFLDTQYI